MKKIYSFFLFFCCFLNVFSQSVYTAKVYDGINFAPVENANVFNLSQNIYTFTDKDGSFSIAVRENDTLVISKSIYRQLLVTVTREKFSSKNDAYFLYCKAIMLKEVRVYGLSPSYEKFKNQVVTMKLSDAYQAFEGFKPTKTDIENAKMANGTTPNILNNTAAAHPITFLYNIFSRRAKMQRLYQELMSYENELDNVQAKYNKQLVQDLTHLPEEQLMEFMVFCHFSYYDLLRMSSEQIVKLIKERFEEYEYYKAIQEKDEF